MALQSAPIPGFNNGVSQQAPAHRRPNQGQAQVNGLGTLVDGLMQRPGTDHLACLTSNASAGVFYHTINRDILERYVVLLTGNVTEPIEVFDLTGTKQTVDYGDLDADLNFTADAGVKAYALPWLTTDLVTNGDFATDTVWTKQTGWTISGGTASCDGTQTATTYIYESASVTAGKTYAITYTISNYSAGNFNSRVRDSISGLRSGNGTYQDVHTTTAGSAYIYIGGDANFIGDVDNVSVVELDTTSNPAIKFKANTVADNTFIVNLGITTGITDAVDSETVDHTVQTFADLPATPADGDVARITGDDISGFDDWYVQFDNSTGVWEECIKPGESLGKFKDYTMPHRLVHIAGTTTWYFAPCIWNQRTVGDTDSTPTPSFVGEKIANVFFFKNRLGFLADDNLIMSRTGEYFNFFAQTALDVLDTDPIDVSATSKQVEKLRSVGVFDKSLILLADQQQFDLGAEGNFTPTTVSITPTTAFSICQSCEPITAGPNLYFVQPKTDFATLREYYVQADSLLNDAADITSHVPQYIPMGHIQMAASNSLDMLLLITEGDPTAIYNYKYFWAGDEKAQSAWSRWEMSGEVLGIGVIDTVMYCIVKYEDTICLESMELETSKTGNLNFRAHLDRMTDQTGVLANELTTFTMPYSIKEFLTYGTEAVDNGDFLNWTGDDPDSWTVANEDGSNYITEDSGKAHLVSDGSATLLMTQEIPAGGGKRYRLSLNISDYSSGDCRITITDVTNSLIIVPTQNMGWTANGDYNLHFETASGCEVVKIDIYRQNSTTTDLKYDNISVKEVVSHPFELINPTTGRPIIGSYAFSDTEIQVAGDYSTGAYHIGLNFDFSFTLTPWYLKDANGNAKLQGRLQVRSLTLNYKDTGFYTLEVEAVGRDDVMVHTFSGARMGVSTLGTVSLHSGEMRHMVMGRNTGITVTIKSSSYLPVAFQLGSWEGIYYPRGAEG
jgi:hypothetical protein